MVEILFVLAVGGGYLVSPADEVKIMSPEELHDNVFPEGERHPAIVLAPPDDIAVRVGPQQVAQQPCGGGGQRSGGGVRVERRRKSRRGMAWHG